MESLKPLTSSTTAAPLNEAAAAAQTANTVSDVIDLLSKRFALDIVVKLPIVVVPVSAVSTSALAVDLGGLSVANELRVVPDVRNSEEIPAVIDRTNLHWTSISAFRLYVYSFICSMNAASLLSVATAAAVLVIACCNLRLSVQTFHIFVLIFFGNFQKFLTIIDLSNNIKINYISTRT